MEDEDDERNEDGDDEICDGEFTVKAVIDGEKNERESKDESGDEDGPVGRRGGKMIERGRGGGNERKPESEPGDSGEKLGEEFGEANFFMTLAATTAEEEPGDNRNVVVPF